MNYLPNKKDLESLRNKELIALLKNAFMEFAEKPYNNLHVTDMPHLRPIVLRLRENELIPITLDLIKEDEQMQQWAFTYLFQKYVARLERELTKSTLNDKCFHYKCISEPRDQQLDFHLSFLFTKYAYYQTHINEPEHKDFWMLSLMTYSMLVQEHGDSKLASLKPLDYLFVPEQEQKEYTAIILKQFIDFVEASTTESSK